MSNLCVIYNFAQLYREPIFKLIDKEWNCMWRVGRPEVGIKDMDISKLHDAQIVETITLPGGWKWQRDVVKLLKDRNIDAFIMLGEPFTLSTWALLLLRPLIARKKKIYFWSHGWYGREGCAKKWMKRAFFGMADKTFLYGNYAREVAIRQGNNPDKLVVIHNSLDFENQSRLRESLKPSDIYRRYFCNSHPTLIFIGRLTKVKKLHQLLEAVGALKNRGEEYNIVFVGDGIERKNLEDKTKELNLSVWFYGACYDDTRNAQLIYDADLCVAPGNVGLTAMHTMAFGTPVLTHNNFPNQMPEFEAIVSGSTGAFFKEDDIDSLASAISDWFKSHNNRREEVRCACISEIAASWCPAFQIRILKDTIK